MTPDAALPQVLTPGWIGSVKIRNRIVRTAHGTVLGGPQGLITDELVAYHETAARGGSGLTILEIATVHKSSPGALRANDDRIISGYATLMARLRPLGTRVFQQLWHGGAQAQHMRRPPWSASAVQPTPTGAMPVAMSQGQIDEIVESFAGAARRTWEGGLDGVELHFAHGYLVQQFLSPLTNRRLDGYGGDLPGRMRFGREILAAVRNAVPRDYPVGVRLSPEAVAGGLSAEDNAEVARALAATGDIDFIDISLGGYFRLEKAVGGMHEPPGYQLPTSVIIAQGTDLPTIVTGRITTLSVAERIIAGGQATFVGMTRAHIADPDLMAKSLAGEEGRVRPCIACNMCMASMNAGRIGCAVNPGAGRERARGDHRLTRAQRTRRIVVVGGGPAGLETARATAERGHKVTLLEAADEVGGQLRVARLAPNRQRVGELVDWFAAELDRLGVDVRLGIEARPSVIDGFNPDAVVVATGSRPSCDGVQWASPGEPIRLSDGRRLLTSWEVITAPEPHRGRAVVVDDTGHYEAIAAAERLILDGVAVTYVTRHGSFAPRVEASLESTPALCRLRRGDFTLHTRAVAVSADATSVALRHLDGGDELILSADLLVMVSANVPQNGLATELSGTSSAIHLVGDALSQRDLKSAIAEAHEVAFLL